MILPDINILVYAHRAESPIHKNAADILVGITKSLSPFALCSFVCSGFVRLVTNHRIFVDPTPLDEAIEFIDNLISVDTCRLVEPQNRHWEIFSFTLKQSRATANLVSDAYLAAIAIENGCTILSHDADFKKFSELKVQVL